MSPKNYYSLGEHKKFVDVNGLAYEGILSTHRRAAVTPGIILMFYFYKEKKTKNWTSGALDFMYVLFTLPGNFKRVGYNGLSSR